MIQRNGVVLSVLGELQEATDDVGLDALTRVALEVDRVLAPFQLPNGPCQEFPEWTGIDEAAHSLYPADAPGDLLPLSCKGEGNLLFDATSMLLVGTTSLSLELQVRTVVEMLLWKRYYLCGMIDSKMMLQAARFSLCAEESEDMLNLPIAVLEAIFDADVKASCFPGSYANMWHVYALSSVLQCNIYSIYPMFNLKIRPYFNRLIRPRTLPKDLEPVTLHIMWSGDLQSGSIFKPNHFVGLVKESDLKLGKPNNEQIFQTEKSVELLNPDSHVSYSNLKDKYNITKRTFYRWRRQSQEHCKKSTTRYEAKHFLQACYQEGKLIPLQAFKHFFPEISRSTYYNWKQELTMISGGNLSTTSSAGEVSPGESTEQESWSSPEARQDYPDQHVSVASMFGLNLGKLEGERAHNVSHMQEAKRCLQNCIAMNTSLPFRVFKRNFPGISRSTYYNWRREAMLFNRRFKTSGGSSEESSDADKSQSPKSYLSPVQANTNQSIVPRMGVYGRNSKVSRLAYLSKKHIRDAAKLHLQRSRMPLAKFKLRYPSLSPCFFWLWRRNPGHNRKYPIISGRADVNQPEIPGSPTTEVEGEMFEVRLNVPNRASDEGSPKVVEGLPMASPNGPLLRYSLPGQTPIDEQTFVMDVVALANFKAKAKLFLQQRFEEKSFPTFKEFRSYFPFTPRSTYYMWKRALHHGVSLVHG